MSNYVLNKNSKAVKHLFWLRTKFKLIVNFLLVKCLL